jgi:aldose 1-epimerase
MNTMVKTQPSPIHEKGDNRRMDFSMNAMKTGATHSIRLEEKHTGASLEVIPSLGGTVHSLSLVPAPGEKARPILFGDTPGELLENPWFRGRILFPFNDRIPAGKYVFMGREYHLPANERHTGDALHGFLYRTPLSVSNEHRDNKSAALTLTGQLKEEEGYPFNPKITMTYTLQPSLFRIDFILSNSTDRRLPWTLGWHPYFFFPGRRDSRGIKGNCGKWTLALPAERYVEVDPNLLPTGDMPEVSGTSLDFREGREVRDQEIDLAFENGKGQTRLYNEDLEILLEQDTAYFPFTQVFTHPDRKSVALEPVTAATNAFNKQELGLGVLGPGEEVRTWIQVRTFKK